MMNTKLSGFISYLAHPMLMPTFLFLILMAFVPESLAPITGHLMTLVLLLVFITTFIIPLLSLVGLKSTSSISSLKLEYRQERIIPFIFITVFYGITSYMFITRLNINHLIVVIVVTSTLLVFLLTLITLFWKISVHATGAGSMTGYLMAITLLFPDNWMFIAVSLMILISGFIVSARLQLNAHTAHEVYSGYSFGLFLSFNSLLLFG